MKNNMKNILQGMNMAKLMDDDDVRSKIVIREDFKSLIPPLNPEELEQLEENILREGVRDPIVLWPFNDQYILIDGHNRFSVCQKHALQFPFKKIDFKDDEEVQVWMVKNQLGRRNLSNEQQSYLRGLRYHQEKQQGRRVDLTSDQNDLKLETADRLAEEYNVSPITIKRDAQFASGVELIGKEMPEVKKEILQGKTKLKKQDIQAVGQNKKSVGDLFQVDQTSQSPVKKRITPEYIAEIAFAFISNEKRSLDEVRTSIGEIDESNYHLNFLLKWNDARRSVND